METTTSVQVFDFCHGKLEDGLVKTNHLEKICEESVEIWSVGGAMLDVDALSDVLRVESKKMPNGKHGLYTLEQGAMMADVCGLS